MSKTVASNHSPCAHTAYHTWHNADMVASNKFLILQVAGGPFQEHMCYGADLWRTSALMA